MKNILDEIRQQPPHIREIFMWLCVIIVFSVVGFAWFRTTAKQFVALLHPEQNQERVFAQRKETQSPFATLFLSLKDLKETITDIFDFSKEKGVFEIQNKSDLEIEPIIEQALPLSGDAPKMKK